MIGCIENEKRLRLLVLTDYLQMYPEFLARRILGPESADRPIDVRIHLGFEGMNAKRLYRFLDVQKHYG